MLELIGLLALIFIGVRFLPNILMFLVKLIFWVIAICLLLNILGLTSSFLVIV